MYAHILHTCRIHRLHLSAHFSNEVNESVMHAATVRSAIVKLDGTAITERPISIVHTSNYRKYSKSVPNRKGSGGNLWRILPLVEELGDWRLMTPRSGLLRRTTLSRRTKDDDEGITGNALPLIPNIHADSPRRAISGSICYTSNLSSGLTLAGTSVFRMHRGEFCRIYSHRRRTLAS